MGFMNSPRTSFLDAASTACLPPSFDDASRALGGVSVSTLRRAAVEVGLEAAAAIERMRAELVGTDGHVRVAQVKSSAVDPVTQVDRASESLIRRRLLEQFPASRVLGEEEGEGDASERHAEGDSGLLWVVDPIDGTVNFVYGIPAYAVSIAATVAGIPVASAVVDVAHGLVYSAATGEEALLHTAAQWAQHAPGKVLRVSTEDDQLQTTLVATGFAYLSERREAQAKLLTRLLPKVRDIRRLGSAAIDLCHVASGRVDAYFEHGLGPWDHAAGVLIAARAGAIVQMPDLNVMSTAGVQVMAAKPAVANALLQELSAHTTGGVLAPVEEG